MAPGPRQVSINFNQHWLRRMVAARQAAARLPRESVRGSNRQRRIYNHGTVGIQVHSRQGRRRLRSRCISSAPASMARIPSVDWSLTPRETSSAQPATAEGLRERRGTIFELVSDRPGRLHLQKHRPVHHAEQPMCTLLPDGQAATTAQRPRSLRPGAAYVFHVTQTGNTWSSSKVSAFNGGRFPEGGVIWGSGWQALRHHAEGGTKRAGTVYQVSF
jgi:hypothetical protein